MTESTGQATEFSGKRALIVDDSKSARAFLARMLEKHGIEVDTAETAEQAIVYLARTRPDEDLLVAAGRGDQSAIGQLYDRFSGQMYGLAMRITQDATLAQDVVQESFVGISLAWYACTTACPRPRAISQRFRGNAASPARNREMPIAPQNRNELSGASMAPGMIIMTTLSMTSMTAIERVSDANASPSAIPAPSPARKRGRRVSEYPKPNASMVATTMVVMLSQ